METSDFLKKLKIEILNNNNNQFDDNYDYLRFGKRPIWKKIIRNFIKRKLKLKDKSDDFINLFFYFDGVLNLYELLADENSKQLLVQLTAYKLLGYERYKLPLNTPELWKGVERMSKYKSTNDYIKAKYIDNDILVYKFDLNELNIPIKMYYTETGIFQNIEIKQYNYDCNNVKICAQNDDIVLDCGAFWGDTSLFFANEINNNGHVYGFEFIPANIDVFNKNVELNPNLKEKITLIPYPLDEKSDKTMFYVENGSGSKASTIQMPDSQEVKTISIDDFFGKYKLSKVDFIKMDIEGAELPALKGGINTIKQFKPKLAISIYHSMDDFVNIAVFLKSLDLDYKFYLKHGTIHNEETVLFAISNK